MGISSGTMLLLMVLALVGNAHGVLYSDDPQSPQNIALTQRALAKLGEDTNGLRLISMKVKWWVFGWSYKVFYIQNGKKCGLKFRYIKLMDIQDVETPKCDAADMTTIRPQISTEAVETTTDFCNPLCPTLEPDEDPQTTTE